MLAVRSASFWRRSTTKNVCTRRWTIDRRCSLSALWRSARSRGQREFRHENSTQGGARGAIRTSVHPLGQRGEGADRAQEKGGLRIPARHERECGGDNPPGQNV